eukprot:6140481-Pyramimonas_sp.AAC.1
MARITLPCSMNAVDCTYIALSAATACSNAALSDGEPTLLLAAARGLRRCPVPACRCCSRWSSSGMLKGFGAVCAAGVPASCIDGALAAGVPASYRTGIGVAIAGEVARIV